MGDVMLVYRVMPEDPNTDLEAIEKEIKSIVEKYGTYKGSSIEKVAFGLKALRPTVVIPDAGGIVDELEEDLKTIEGIQSSEAVDITLI
ncbi:MAG: elongation factor 1-beta [Thermoplasmata archaeon]